VAPAIDVYERDGKLVVHADLPGLQKQKEDVKVEATDDTLIIQGSAGKDTKNRTEGTAGPRAGMEVL
jgi:HSP20 family protein